MSEAQAEVVENDDYSGQLPVGWLSTQLGDICEVLDKRRVPLNAKQRAERKRKAKALYPYYGATGQVDEIDDYLFDGEHVLVGEDGAPFFDRNKDTAYIVNGKFWVNNHAHIICGLDGILNRFLRHQLNVIDYHGYVSGTTRLKLTQAALRELPIRLAPTAEQDHIVSKIDELFSDIEAGERALKRARVALARYRKSVLKAAVTGDLTADWREANRERLEPADKLLARILDARRAAWKKAERAKLKAKGAPPKRDVGKTKYTEPVLPEANPPFDLPSCWGWVTIDVIADVVGGVTVDRKRIPKDPVTLPYLRVANVQRGFLDLTEVKDITVERERAEKTKLQDGDILFNEGGDIDKLGRGWIWEAQIPECIHQNHVFRARLVGQEVQPKFISWYGNVLGADYFLTEGKQTTNLASISMTKIKALPVPLPPGDEQLEIVSRTEEALSKADHVEAGLDEQERAARALKQSILKAAFEGRLVSQDPADEPAAKLLERVKALKEETKKTKVTCKTK